MKHKVVELEDTFAGCHISKVCRDAVALSNKDGVAVHFSFNGTDVTVQPGELPEAVERRWNADMNAAAEAWRNSEEYRERERKQAEDHRSAIAAHMVEAAQTEEELRDAKVPWPYTKEQLVEYVESLINRQHSYGTCVYAMSMAAEAAFNFVAHQLGVTGFQSSCADLDFIRRTRSLDGPFMLVKAHDAMYPQSDPLEKVQEAMQGWRPWLKEQAQKELSGMHDSMVHPDVKAHWERLASHPTPAATEGQ